VTLRHRRVLAWGALIAFSAVLHLWGLGERSYHHDESVHAKLSWDLAERGVYRYDPTYHGPVLYYLTAASELVLGDNDFTARLPVALAGIALLLVAWGLRRPFGERAAWWTGFLATVSPVTLYFGRFLRMDVLEAAFASGALLAWLRIVQGSRRAWVWLGVWTGLAFATKENAYVTAALVVLAACLLALDHGLSAAVRSAAAWLRERFWPVVTALSVFTLVTVPLMTFGFRHPKDWAFPVIAIRYWWHQHSIQRVGGPWWFHLPRLAAYEYLAIGAALVWAARRWRRLRPVELFLLIMGVTSVGMYCYLGEKVPWHEVHQVLFFLPLAGAQLARTFGPQGRWWSRAIAGTALAASIVTALVASFVLDEITPALERVEMLQFVQTTPEAHAVAEEGVRLGMEGSENPVAAVSGEAAWPLNWYWRHLDVRWATPVRGSRPPLVVCDPDEEAAVREVLGQGYVRERIPLRAWWLIYEGQPGPRDVVRWLFTRRPWGPIGATDVVVLRRVTDVPSARSEVPPGSLAAALGVTGAAVEAEGFLGEPRGLAAGPGGLAVADATLSAILLRKPDGRLDRTAFPDRGWNQPEAVAWLPDGSLAVADTWNHRVVIVRPGDPAVVELPPPPEGWYGPRGLAAAPDGALAVTDTGHRRVVVYPSPGAGPQVLTPIGEASPLLEPVGIAWLPGERVLVCDTGHHRLVVLGPDGGVERAVALPGGWPDFYSRPQVTVLGPDRWLATDPPRRSLWLVEGERPVELTFPGAGIVPAGVAWDPAGRVLWLGDLAGRLWRLEVNGG